MDADEQTRSLLRAYGERTAPSPEKRAHAWQALTASLTATTPSRVSIGPKVWVVGGIIVAVTALWIATRPTETTTVAPPPMPAPTSIDIAPIAPPSVAVHVEPSVPSPPTATPLRHPRVVEPEITTTDAVPEESPNDLAEELALMRSARAALARGDATEVLAELDRHAARFPHGTFASERDVVRVSALCAAGRDTEARAVADAAGDRPAIARALSRCTPR